MNIIDIIKFKYPNIQNIVYWSTQYDGTPWEDPYDGLVWENKEIPKPTKKEIEKWTEEYVPEVVRIYPPIQEQLDMIYHDKMNNTSVWVDTITAIKNEQ